MLNELLPKAASRPQASLCVWMLPEPVSQLEMFAD